LVTNNEKAENVTAQQLDLLTGGEPESPRDYIILLTKLLQDPKLLPRLLKKFCSLKSELTHQDLEDFRMALIRVQIDCELRMHEDILLYQQRRYVFQVVEILIFGDLLLGPRDVEEEMD